MMSRFLILVLFSVLLVPSTSFAQPATTTSPLPGVPDSTVSGPLNCFDYYTFGSVEADLQPTIGQTIPGAAITFSGEVKSTNPYPLLDGTLYVKIFRRNEATFRAGDGNEVVDQFVIKEGITLPTQGTLPIAYEWKVPQNAEGGEYYAAYFFTTAKRYNLMGLSFTDDVVGNTAAFSVVTDNAAIAKLSKSATTLNGLDHKFAAFPLHFKASDTVIVETTIKNPSDQTKTLPLQWNQYAWDAMNKDNLRFSKTEVITLLPNETKTVTYEVQPQRESVVYVTAVTQDNEAKSILNIRYARDGIEETRINFPGVTKFPIQKGTSETLFACAHSVNSPFVAGNTLTLSLKDRTGKTIHEYRYEGTITGDMPGFGDNFTAETDINYATLTATLERNGVIIEQVTQTYDCQTIDPSSCFIDEPIKGSLLDFITKNFMNIIFTLVALLLSAAVVTFLVKKRRNHIDSNSPPMTTPLSILIFLLMLPGLFLLHPEIGEAKNVTWNKMIVNNSGEGFVGSNGMIGYGHYFVNPNIAINYNANITDNSNGSPIADGSSVGVGSCFKIVNNTFLGSDVSWFATPLDASTGLGGGIFDSPNGYWISGANPPPIACLAQDYVGSRASGIAGSNWLYSPLSINPPNVTVDITGSTAGLTDQGNGVYCVNSPGSIKLSNNYSSTNGNFYIRQESYDFLGTLTGSCSGDQSPMALGDYAYDSWNAVWVYSNIQPFTLDVPQQNITFNLTAVASNNPPAVPTITGPSTGIVNTGYDFNFVTTDGDNDNIRYGITDAACTTVTEWLPGAGYVASGVNQTKSGLTWGSANTYNLYVLAEDSQGGRSACASHNIVISAAPPITADLKINGSDGPLTVNKNTVVNLSWNSAYAASCTKWGGAWGSGEAIALNSTDTTTVTANATYMINCSGVIDQVQVSVVNQPPSAPTINYLSGTLQTNSPITFNIQGSDPDNDNVFYELDWDNDGTPDGSPTMVVPSNTVQPATNSWNTAGQKTFQARTVDTSGASSGWTQKIIDISQPNLTVGQNQSPLFGTFNTSSSTYNQVTVYFRTQNGGSIDTNSTADYRFEFDLNDDGSYETTVNRTNGLGLIAASGGENDSEIVAGPIPFGTHGVRITVDSSGNPGKVTETNEGDNVYTGTITAAPPDPGLSIIANPVRVQNGQTTVVAWSVSNPYTMVCDVYGPGMAIPNFNPLITGYSGGNAVAGPITAKSEYTISCTAAGTTFTDTVIVEAEGVIEEI
ncbi:MAG: hypothetical protein AAB618_01625 [Patescibacteria group bacterium]